MDGVAENGVDYERLPGAVTIPAGQRQATVFVRPLADDLAERYEAVILQLEPPAADEVRYLIGRPARALAVISDQPWDRFVGVSPCQRLDVHCTLVVFDAEAGFDYRVEASEDLWQWETIAVQTATDPVILFTDDDSATRVRRFYRIAPETVPIEN
jgi:hypothetical protein